MPRIPSHQLKPLERKSLGEFVAGQIHAAIVSGGIRPEARLIEVELARQFGTSRAPVREALRLLNAQGLLVTRPNRGTFVRALTPQDIDEIFSLRCLLEPYAVGEAVRRAGQPELAELRHFVDAMRDAAIRGSAVELVEADLGLHRRIAALAGNRRLVGIFDSLASSIRMVITLIEGFYKDGYLIAEDHQEIVDALCARNARAAKAAMAMHLREAWKELRKRFQRAQPKKRGG